MPAPQPLAEPIVVMPALLAGEDVVLRLPADLRGQPVTASVGRQDPERECVPDESGSVVLWNTARHPDGEYTIHLELPGGTTDLPFEITHELFREGRRRFGRPQTIAHRGGSGHAPENTLAAYLSAIDRGADACEMDVRLAADGELVIMHDDSVDRTTNGRGRVADLALTEIAALKVGSEPVPTLREVFDAVGDRSGFQLHVKLDEDEARNDLLLGTLAITITGYGYEDRCAILATKPRTLDILKHNPRLHIDVEIGPGPAAETFATLGPDWFLAGGHRLKTSDFHLTRSALVREAHAHGIPVVCWARDSSDQSVERLLRLGVDAVMTDYPERMGAIVDRLASTAQVG